MSITSSVLEFYSTNFSIMSSVHLQGLTKRLHRWFKIADRSVGNGNEGNEICIACSHLCRPIIQIDVGRINNIWIQYALTSGGYENRELALFHTSIRRR